MTRRGTSLVELLVVLTLWGLLLSVVAVLHAAAGRLVASERRALRAQRDLTTVTALIDGAVTGSAVTDLVVRPDTLEFDRPLAVVTPCARDGSTLVIPVPVSGFGREPTAGRDQALLFSEGPVRWIRRGVVAATPATCPGGASALRLDLSGPVGFAWQARLVTPVRLRRYGTAAVAWLGLEDRLGGGGIQPIAGPLGGGVDFELVGQRLITTVESGASQRFATLLGGPP